MRRALFFSFFVAAIGACSFAAIDKIGKRCEVSCDPYACVDHVCVPRDAAMDTTMDVPDVVEAGPPDAGPCTLDTMDDGGTIVLKDCFDDRMKAAGLGTLWPNSSGSPGLDDAASISPPQSLLMMEEAGTAAFVASSTIKNDGGAIERIHCTMMIRMDALGDSVWMMNMQIGAMDNESISMIAYPTANNAMVWYLYYQHANTADSTVHNTLQDKSQWSRFTIDVSAAGVAAEYGNTSGLISAGPLGSMTSFRLQIGPYNPPNNGGITMHVDDVVCTTH